MKKLILVLAVSFLFLFISQASAYNVTYASFNGNFENGTTLYSNKTYFLQVNMTARDPYPIRNCTVYNLTAVTKKVCTTVNRTRTCVNVTIMRTRTRCQSLKALCYNPYARNTNQLSLTNFAYSTNNISWFTIPYTKLTFNNVNLTFRLIVPSLCKPTYDINNVIKLEY